MQLAYFSSSPLGEIICEVSGVGRSVPARFWPNVLANLVGRLLGTGMDKKSSLVHMHGHATTLVKVFSDCNASSE